MLLSVSLLFVAAAFAGVIPGNNATIPSQGFSTLDNSQLPKLLRRDLSGPLFTADGAPYPAPPGFEWDSTCTSEDDIKAIWKAIQDAYELAFVAERSLDELQKLMPYYTNRDADLARNLEVIDDNDPAFVQMFGAEFEQVDRVKAVFENVRDQLQDPAAARPPFPPLAPRVRGDGNFRVRNGRLVRIVCDKEARVKDTKGGFLCRSAPDTGQAATAWTAQIPEDGELFSLEPKYQFPDHAVMIFCPPFFNAASQRDFVRKATNNNEGDQCNLDNLDSQARIVLHEMTHLKWVGATGSLARKPQPDGLPDVRVEVYGYIDCAVVASEEEHADWRPDGFAVTSLNADSYAWYAVYNLFNRNPGCPKVPDRCYADVWPHNKPKPVDYSELFGSDSGSDG